VRCELLAVHNIARSRPYSLLWLVVLDSNFGIVLLLVVPAMSVELFRYRGAAKDGGTLEYVFDAGDQISQRHNKREIRRSSHLNSKLVRL
jgi:hypothetical protein